MTHLDLRRSILTSAFLSSVLATAPALETLILDAASGLTADVFEVVSKLPNLRRLSLRGCRSITATDLEHLSVPSLHSLDVSSCGAGVTATGVVRVASAAPNLQHLAARGVVLDDAALVALTASCRLLTSLSFGNSNPFGCRRTVPPPVTAVGLTALAANTPHLQHLVMAANGAVSAPDTDVAALVRRLPNLHAVDFSGHVMVGDATAAALAASPWLTSASLFRCLALTDVGARALLRHGAGAGAPAVDFGGCTHLSAPVRTAAQLRPVSRSTTCAACAQ